MGTIRPIVVFALILATFCFVGSISVFGRFGNMNATRQAVFFVPVLIKSYFVTSDSILNKSTDYPFNHTCAFGQRSTIKIPVLSLLLFPLFCIEPTAAFALGAFQLVKGRVKSPRYFQPQSTPPGACIAH